MPDLVVVDTDILIDTGRGVEEALVYLGRIEELFSASISAVTEMELIIGCRNKEELRLLEAFLNRFQRIEIDGDITATAVDLLKRYRLSHGLLIADALIAATAISRDASLASKNQRDYRFIEKLHLLPYSTPLP